MTEHNCHHDREFGELSEKVKVLESEKKYNRNKFVEVFRRLVAVEIAPGEKANKEISTVKLAIVVAVVTAVVQTVMKVLV